MESKEEFSKNLPARLEAYRRQTEETRRDTERAERVLESQRSVLLQVEMKKQKGKEADAKDRRILQSMKHGRECLTPVLMTYQKDGQPVPGVDTVQKAKKQVEAALGIVLHADGCSRAELVQNVLKIGKIHHFLALNNGIVMVQNQAGVF